MNEQSIPVNLSKVEVKSVSGEIQKLGDLWKHQTVLLVFIRHFG